MSVFLFKITNFPCVRSKVMPRNTLFEMKCLFLFNFLNVENNIFFKLWCLYFRMSSINWHSMRFCWLHYLTCLTIPFPFFVIRKIISWRSEILHCFHLNIYIFKFNASEILISNNFFKARTSYTVVSKGAETYH